jgi:hemoglobin-like flavoprotein
VQALGRRHAGYGVEDRHYAVVESALLWTLKEGLGSEFTPEVEDAWRTAYGVLASTMKQSTEEQKRAA